MRYCLDTCIVVSSLRDKAPEYEKRILELNPEAICIPEIVRGELLVGARKSQRPTHREGKVSAFIAPFNWIPFAGEAVEHYASIRAGLEAAGQIIGANDLMIAATARSLGAVLVTENLDEFQRVPGLLVESWRSP